MRTSVRLGQTAIAVLAFAAPLAAQGRGRGQQDDKARQEARAHESAPQQTAPRAQQGAPQHSDPRAQQGGAPRHNDPRVVVSAPTQTNPRPVFGGRVNTDDRRAPDARAQQAAPRGYGQDQARGNPRAGEGRQIEQRAQVQQAPQVVSRWRPGDDRARGVNGGNGGNGGNGWRGTDNRPQVFERDRVEHWRGESRWRQDNTRIVLSFFAQPRYRYVPRYAYATLPYGWEQAIYDDGYFPYEYDQWADEVPVDLAYQLPPLYGGYRRFIFGDRLIVIDRLTRHVVLVIRI